MASQSQSSGDQGDDLRFSELLKPIKDLAQNWEVSKLSCIRIDGIALYAGAVGREIIGIHRGFTSSYLHNGRRPN